MKLDKEDIATAKEMAKTLQQSKNSELIVVGNLLAHLLVEREAPQPKEPEQEPVAKVKRNSSGQIYIEWRDGEGAIAALIGAEFYTTPPQRKPLTDERIADIVIEMNGNEPTALFWRDLAQAIEAAHGIKGDA